jgi:hypothetical protein
MNGMIGDIKMTKRYDAVSPHTGNPHRIIPITRVRLERENKESPHVNAQTN